MPLEELLVVEEPLEPVPLEELLELPVWLPLELLEVDEPLEPVPPELLEVVELLEPVLPEEELVLEVLPGLGSVEPLDEELVVAEPVELELLELELLELELLDELGAVCPPLFLTNLCLIHRR